MTIVITKIDEAILNQPDEDTYDEELLISKVQAHLCEEVFKISMTDLPRDVIFPVSGRWALMAKQLRDLPCSTPIVNQVQMEIDKLTSTSDDQREATIDEKALWLLKSSNIDKLESRYSQINVFTAYDAYEVKKFISHEYH